MSKKHKLFASTATAALVASAIVPVASAANLNDFDSVPAYAQEAVQHLADNNILQGDANGNFNPSQTLTRAQAAEVLAKALKLEATGTEDFSDVKAGDWFYNAVVATSPELFEGDGTGKFNPKAQLTRAQAAKVISVAYNLTGEADLSVFTDANSVPAWSKEFFSAAVANGVINGKGSALAPNAQISRAEFATMVKRAMDSELTVESVSAINDISVNEGEVASLTNTVEVTLSNGTKAQKEVKWDVTGLDTTKPGVYTVKGDVADTDLEASVKVTVVAVNPEVVSVNAINGATLVVKFNKAITPDSVIDSADGTIKSGLLTVTKVDGAGTVSVTDGGSLATLSADGKTLTVTSATGAAFNNVKFVATINADVAKATDGKFVPKFVSNIIEAADTTAPTVTDVKKLDASKVRVFFSEPLSNEGSWSFKFADGSSATVTPSATNIAKGYVDLTIDAGVAAGKEITATVIGAKDYAGNLVNPNPFTVTFSKGQLDGTKPSVTSVVTNGLTSFEVKFSEEVQGFTATDISINGVDRTVDDGDGVATGTEAIITQDTTDKTKYTVTVAAQTSGLNTISIGAGLVTDLSGELSESFSKVVEFKADQTKPTLTSHQIKKDENGEEYLHLFFSEAVTEGTVNALTATKVKDYVTTNDDMDISAGSIVPNTAGKEFKVKLASVTFDGAALETGAQYTVALTGGFADTSSLALDTASITFVRGTDALTTVQSVSTVTKVAGTPSVVKVTFAQPVDGATATNIANYNISGVVVEKAEVRNGEASAVYLTLKSDSNTLSGERNVTVSGVKTKDGVAMSSSYAGTVDLDENVKPTFTASLVAADSIKLTFSENVIDATDGITVADLEVKYNATALTETGATPQVVGIYSDAAMTTAITNADSVGVVYVKLASGTITDLSKSLTVETQGSTVKDAKGNVWAASTVTVAK